MQRFPTALEQDGIAALEAQPADLNQRIRTRFKDHADHADRAADARKHQPVRQLRAKLLFADGVFHGSELLQAQADVVQLMFIKAKPLERRRGKPFLLSGFHVLFVRGKNVPGFCSQRCRHGQQRIIPNIARRGS